MPCVMSAPNPNKREVLKNCCLLGTTGRGLHLLLIEFTKLYQSMIYFHHGQLQEYLSNCKGVIGDIIHYFTLMSPKLTLFALFFIFKHYSLFFKNQENNVIFFLIFHNFLFHFPEVPPIDMKSSSKKPHNDVRQSSPSVLDCKRHGISFGVILVNAFEISLGNNCSAFQRFAPFVPYCDQGPVYHV